MSDSFTNGDIQIPLPLLTVLLNENFTSQSCREGKNPKCTQK